jgi:hypothetical protein
MYPKLLVHEGYSRNRNEFGLLMQVVLMMGTFEFLALIDISHSRQFLYIFDHIHTRFYNFPLTFQGGGGGGGIATPRFLHPCIFFKMSLQCAIMQENKTEENE